VTLPELLVVLAIVGLLAGLAAGAVLRARSAGWAARSAGTLRQLVAANLAYAVDHGGKFCPAQEPKNLIRWHGGRTTAGGVFDPTKGFLSPYLGQSGQIMRDPALTDTLKGSASFEEGTGGYGYNATYLGGTPAAMFEPASVAVLGNGASVLMFATTVLPRRSGLQEYAFSEPFFSVNPDGSLGPGLAPSLHFRHNGLAQVGWADGHVSSERPNLPWPGKNLYGGDNAKFRVGWFGPEADNGAWNPGR
jgi:prepilin-type processing-associated H-X9-DG protein/prepilin-type N-terminal cleavage/methylation domain-containing protein